MRSCFNGRFLLPVLAIFLFLLWCSTVVFTILRLSSRKRLTPVFILMGIRKKKIYQSLNWTGRQYFKRLKHLSKTKSIEELLSLAAVMYYHQLKGLIKVLQVNQRYRTKTHLLPLIEKASQEGHLNFTARKVGKRSVITEAIAILGLRNVTKLICSQHRGSLTRAFYNIEFTVNDSPPRKDKHISSISKEVIGI